MGIEVGDCTSFITDCEKERRDWYEQSKASWREVKKLTGNNKLFSYKGKRDKVRYPIWNSTFNIRKPLVLSRMPIVVGTDTSHGNDPFGRTAAILIERLGRSIMTSFPFMDTMYSVRDDALITNLGQGRAYYECEWRTEPVKEYLQIMSLNDGSQALVDSQGQQVEPSEDIQQDDKGYFRVTDQTEEVEHERVFFKHTLYGDFYVDPNATRWNDTNRVGFAADYSRRDFKAVFGNAALLKIPDSSVSLSDTKRQVIRVYEVWDKYDRETKYFVQGTNEYLPKPFSYKKGNESDDPNSDDDDIYGLEGFFPCPEPMIFNAPTDCFYPVTEYYQLVDLIDDIHEIASKIYQITRAIRPRLFYDSGIKELQKLINEASTADAVGIENLTQLLNTAGGNIQNAVAYLPIKDMVDALINYSNAFQEKLTQFDQLTGTSDLLRGMTDNVARTFGEQQMKAKYAMNQIEPFQREMQRFIRDAIELLCEMALKNFKPETLAEYMSPETLDREDQQRYDGAIQLLKDDKKRRFRLDVETDSTIALNEEFQKAAVIEAANTLSGIIEKTSTSIQQTPILGPVFIKLAEIVSGTLRIGKDTMDEMEATFKEAMDQARAAAAQPPQPPTPDPRIQVAQIKAQSDAQIESQRLQARMQESFGKLQQSGQALQLKFQQISNDLQLGMATLQEKSQADNVSVESKAQTEQMWAALKDKELELDSVSKQFQRELEQTLTQLETVRTQSEIVNKQQDNQRLEAESMAKMITAVKPHPQAAPTIAPAITVNHKYATPNIGL